MIKIMRELVGALHLISSKKKWDNSIMNVQKVVRYNHDKAPIKNDIIGLIGNSTLDLKQNKKFL